MKLTFTRYNPLLIFNVSPNLIVLLLLISFVSLSLTGCDEMARLKQKLQENSIQKEKSNEITNTKIVVQTQINNDVDKSNIDSGTLGTINQESIAQSSGKSKLLRIATEASYPPFNYIKSDGNLAGFDVDLAKVLCNQMKVECQIVVQDWKNIISGLEAKEYDAIISAMSVTPERLQVVDFTQPYYKSRLVWVAHQESGFNPEMVSGMTLASQTSTTIGSYLLNNYDIKKSNNINLYANYNDAYLELLSGRNNAVLTEKINATTWLKANPYFAIIGEEIDNNDKIAIAVRKGDAIGADFNKALQTIQENGVLDYIESVNLGDGSVLQTSVVTPSVIESLETENKPKPE